MNVILGISAFYHDSAACLLVDGYIVAAAQEERFTRIKQDSQFPKNSIQYCLSVKNLTLSDVDQIVFYEKPFLKFERLMETYMNFAPKGFLSFQKAFPLWIKEKLFQKKLLKDFLSDMEPQVDLTNKLLFNEHHTSHAASAFYPSPFEEALVLTMDGVGEWATTSVYYGQGNKLEKKKEIHFPHSLGLLYSAFTYYCGFKVNSGEYKLMGLAPYGEPRFKNLILSEILQLHTDGSFSLNQKYFDYCTGLKMISPAFEKLFSKPARVAESEITPFYMDIAASIQGALEEAILHMTKKLSADYPTENLVLAGGVALNCVANSKILNQGYFKNIWIQPAAGDAGGALGAALSCWHQHLGKTRTPTENDNMGGAQLGPAFEQTEIESTLNNLQAPYKVLSQDQLLEQTADSLTKGMAIGWFQGRMEFGPRALGQRSILGDPRNKDMQKTLNLKIKYRESFRPFAPSVLEEEALEWFETPQLSPYMLLTSKIQKDKRCDLETNEEGFNKLKQTRSLAPAITHVDNSARIQTVNKDRSPLYHKLITRFFEKTGCPMVINTSFNVRGEPIVCTPEDAYRCFMGSEMDILVIGNCFLIKSEQNSNTKHSQEFAKD